MKKFGLLLLLVSFSVQAQIVARVIEVNGNAFAFSGNKAKSLQYGSKIWDLSEVMVEDGSTLSLVAPEGYVIYVNGGSLLKFFKGNVELKNGYIWVENNSTDVIGSVSTSNSIANFSQGQFIYSFDNNSGKTQLLVLTGNVKFANALEPNLKINVPAGNFSLIDKSYEAGLPRGATKVGLTSYKKIKGVFANFDKLQEKNMDEMFEGKKTSARSIASVNDQFSGGSSVVTSSSKSRHQGKLVRVKTYESGRVPASVSAMDYYTEMKNEQAKLRKPLKTGKQATIHYYGVDFPKIVIEQKPKKAAKMTRPEHKMTGQRKPASVSGTNNLIKDLKKTEFEKSLDTESQKIKRHSNEVNSLIDELNSYRQDYQKNY